MTNEELISEIKSGHNKADNLLQLYSQNRGIIYRWSKPLSDSCDMSDLMQESFIALCDAVSYYDPEHENASFLKCLRLHILNHFREIIHNNTDISIPGNMYYLINQYKKMRDGYLVSLNKEPTDRIYCETLKITMRELSLIRKNLNLKAQSLDAPIIQAEGDELSLADILADERDDFETVLDDIEQEQLKDVIDNILSDLPEKWRDILKMKYIDNMTMRECGEAFEMTQEGIRKIIGKAIRKIRGSATKMKALREFVSDDDIYDLGMHYRGVRSFMYDNESSTEKAVFSLMEYRESLHKEAQKKEKHHETIDNMLSDMDDSDDVKAPEENQADNIISISSRKKVRNDEDIVLQEFKKTMERDIRRIERKYHIILDDGFRQQRIEQFKRDHQIVEA